MQYLKYKLFGYDANGNPVYYAELVGKSTDSKPTTGLVSGSTFLAADTGVTFVLDAESTPAAWTEMITTTQAAT